LNVHKTWKEIHYRAIAKILQIDNFLNSNNAEYLDNKVVRNMEYFRQLWRRVNDAIFWSICGGYRHLVKRFCLYRDRPPLNGANFKSELMVLNRLNVDADCIAILNDTTSCVDIGDIIYANPKKKIIQPLEVKEGKVNQIITDLFSINPKSIKYEDTYENFLNEYGKKEFNQMMRCYRQIERSEQVVDLIKNEKGVDPYSLEKMKVSESFTQEKSFDDQLEHLIEKTKYTGEGVLLIDGCLWNYVSYDVEKRFDDQKKTF